MMGVFEVKLMIAQNLENSQEFLGIWKHCFQCYLLNFS